MDKSHISNTRETVMEIYFIKIHSGTLNSFVKIIIIDHILHLQWDKAISQPQAI